MDSSYLLKIQKNRTVDLGIFVQKLAGVFRVWSPVNRQYAQYYNIAKEASASDEYYNLSGAWGIMEYFEVRNEDSRTGTFTGYGGPNSYAAKNATMTITFTGTGLRFRSLTENRGGLWRFSLDGGTQVVDVSVYSDTAMSKLQSVFSGLDYGEHTVVATFTGDDPEHVPSSGAGTARGWVSTDTSATNLNKFARAFYIEGSPTPNHCDNSDTNEGVSSAISSYIFSSNDSHKEFAWLVKGLGEEYVAEWIPNHGVTGTSAKFADVSTDRTMKIDDGEDNLIETKTDQYYYADSGNVVNLSQSFIGVNKTEPTRDLFNISLTYSFSQDGITITGSAEAIDDIDTSTCYLSILDATPEFSHVVVDSMEIALTGGTVEGTVIDNAAISAWSGNAMAIKKTGTNLEKSFALAMQLESPNAALNLDREDDQALIFGETPNRLKVYPVVVFGKPINTGVVFNWTAKFAMGLVPDAYNTLK